MSHTFTYLNLTESTTSGPPPFASPSLFPTPSPTSSPNHPSFDISFLSHSRRALAASTVCIVQFPASPPSVSVAAEANVAQRSKLLHCCAAWPGGWHCGEACYSMLWIICSRASRHMWGHKYKHTHTPVALVQCHKSQPSYHLAPSACHMPNGIGIGIAATACFASKGNNIEWVMCNVKRIVQQRIQMQLHKSAPTQKGRVGLPCLLQDEIGREVGGSNWPGKSYVSQSTSCSWVHRVHLQLPLTVVTVALRCSQCSCSCLRP